MTGFHLPAPLRPWVRTFGPAVLLIAVQQVLWPTSAGTFVSGTILGLAAALAALGMALIWRANRIVNFAMGDLGALPVTLLVLLIEFWKWSYGWSLAAGAVAAVLVGALVELLFVRRFRKAPRLILTVVTLGVSQLLSFAGILLPSLWDQVPAQRRVPPPFHFSFSIGAVVFGANDLIAAIAAPALMVGLVVFLKRTDAGVAIRAAAERSDRASLLGVPVGRLETQVWVIASFLSFASVFLTSGINSLSPGFAVSLTVVLRALAALVIAGMTDLVGVAATSVALGILDTGIRANQPDSNLVPVILIGVILVALMLRRAGSTRADLDDSSSWKVADETRPVPAELARLAEVRAVRWGLGVVVAALVVWFPNWVGTGTALKAGAVLVFATIGVSIVVLTGWAGQVSLGQMTFVGIGGAVAAWATVDRGLDPAIALLAGAVAGAVVAVIVGLPALRLRGLYLAVTTLGLALAASAAVFNNAYWDWIPVGTFTRPPIFGRIALDSATRVYYLALAVLVASVVAMVGVRRSRTGRVLIALRENERAAASYGVSIVRAKLVSFALSGFIAALAGGVFVLHQASFRSDSYEAGQSISVFVSTVIGGLGSLTGGILGAVFQRGSQWLLPGQWQMFASSVGVLFVLLAIPDGLGGVLFRCRDAWLRWVAARHRIAVPSLRGNAADAEGDFEEAA